MRMAAASASRGLFLLVSMLVLIILDFNSSIMQVSAWYRGTVHVKVTNKLDPSRSPLRIHCKSADDDLGFHQIVYGQTYEFTFKNNIWDSTLFFCSLEWGRCEGKQHIWDSFDIYKATRDIKRCHHECQWDVEESGLYTFDNTGVWARLYYWRRDPFPPC